MSDHLFSDLECSKKLLCVLIAALVILFTTFSCLVNSSTVKIEDGGPVANVIALRQKVTEVFDEDG